MSSNRRDFLKNSSLVTACSFLIPSLSFAEESKENFSTANSFLIENAQILTMDDDLGTIEKASIFVEDGLIKNIEESISVSSAIKRIDGTSHIVMPGLIDNHWHTWTALLRSMAGKSSEDGYFKMTGRYGKLYNPDTMKLATKIALAEAINAGVTTVNDFNHNAREKEFVRASFEAFQEMGVGGRIAYGYTRDMGSKDATPFSAIEELQKEAKEKYPNLQLAFGSRSLGYPKLKEDWQRARKLGLPITIHASSNPKQKNQIRKLAEMDLLGADVNIIHANAITAEEIEMVKANETAITMTPYSEMRIGFGFPKVQELMKNNVFLGVGTDTTALTGSCNLLNSLKLLLNVGNAQALNEFAIDHFQLLKLATIDGAKILGMQEKTGSLQIGKQADLMMIDKSNLNLVTGNQPENLVVEAVQPENISLVASQGKILKENGKLTQVDSRELMLQAEEVFTQLTKRLN